MSAVRRCAEAMLALCVLFTADRAAAQPAAGRAQQPTAARVWRGWLDVSVVSLQSLQGEQTYTFSRILHQETAIAATVYPKLPRASGPVVDVGFLLNGQLAFGVTYSGVNYTYNVGLGVSVPHPTLFNRSAIDADSTASRFERQDRSLDLSLVFVPRTPDSWRVRLFAGPTYFSVKQGMVQTVHYNQVFTLAGFNSVDIDSFTETQVQANAWGFNAGADVAYFFSTYAGVGGILSVNKGTVEITEPLSVETEHLDAGRVTAGAGLRLRF